MVGRPRPGCVMQLGRSAKGLVVLLLCLPLGAQLRLQDVNVRIPAGTFAPAHLNEKLRVTGVANAPPFHFPAYSLLSIESGDAGAVIRVADPSISLDKFQPGDEVQVEGTIREFAGMAVIEPTKVDTIGRKAVPTPLDLTVEELQGTRYLGRLVRTELRVSGHGDNAAGVYLDIEGRDLYRIFAPRSQSRAPSFSAYASGDTVQVTGIAYQFCQVPPFNRYYQVLVNSPDNVSRRDRGLPPLALAGAMLVTLMIGFFLWSRERRMRNQRETLRRTYELGEQILGASSVQSILKTISTSLPSILGVTRVHLYTYNRGGRTLDEVAEENAPQASISLSTPPGGKQAGAVACFHYRTLLVIPDIDRSPFPLTPDDRETPPRSLLFVPMFAQGEVIGVLELDQDNRVRDFSAGEQELAQHLGNQIGVAIRLLDQRSVQEQLFRTEKLAAVGRLISGVVNDARAPLASISKLASRAVAKARATPAEREVGAIAAEAQKASAIVARLVSFAAAEQVEARPVDVNTLLRNLIEFRERDWKASGIRVRDLTLREPLYVLGSHGQLEQAFLTLLVHAEQSLAQAEHKNITLRTSVMAKRLLVELAFSAQPDARTPQETAAVLGVTRSVITGHGGEVRLIEKANAEPRFEVELPVTATRERVPTMVPPSTTAARDSSRRLTALVIDSEDSAQRQLLGLLSARGFRVVPVDNADTGLELAQRMRFDAAFCSVHAPGLNWVELSERMQSRVPGFILLSDGYNAELAADFEGEGRFVVAKPVQEADLDRVLRAMDAPVPSR